MSHRVWSCVVAVVVPVAIAACGGDENEPPLAPHLAITMDEDTVTEIDALAGVVDPDGDALTVTTAQAPGHRVEVRNGRSLVLTPAGNFHGTIALTYAIDDGSSETAVNAAITVRSINDAPVAVDKTVSGHRGMLIVLEASDVDGDTLTYEATSRPAHGALSGKYPVLQYEPVSGFAGDDAFTYRANDGTLTSEATIHIQVGPGAAPTAAGATIDVAEDTAQPIALSATDPDGDPLTYAIERGPAHGTLSGALPTLSYRPAPNFNGDDELSFSVSDGYGSSNIATVTLRVQPRNDAPTAIAQEVTTSEDTAVAIVLAATDVDGDALIFAATQPGHGTVEQTASGFTYTPTANFHGFDQFGFAVRDAAGAKSTALVTLTVTAVDDAPSAEFSAVSLQEDVAKAIPLAAADVDGDPLTVEITAPPAHGTLVGTSPPLTYTPAADYNGADEFTYRVTAAGVASQTAKVALQIAPVNDAPVANSATIDAIEDTEVSFTLTGSDVEGQALTFKEIVAPSDGTLTVNGATLRYQPAANTHGMREVRFRAFDGSLTSASATITLAIAPTNDDPTTQDDFAATDPATPLAFAVAANDSDLDGDTVEVDAAAAPAHGSIELLDDGRLRYTPNPGFSGIELIDYTIRDGHGGFATGRAHVGVGAFPPDAPAEVLMTIGTVATTTVQAPSLSRDGRYLAFTAIGALLPEDTNGVQDVYVFDRGTRALTRVSVRTGGGQGSAASRQPHISADGRYVVFASIAPNLVDGDTNGKDDVFRHDRATGETVRVSVALAGETTGHSSDPEVSDDGNLVAFASDAFELVANDRNGVSDIFVRDLAAGITTRVSVSSDGGEANELSIQPTISGDGRFVGFASLASVLVPDDRNAVRDVFVRDRVAGTTKRVSISSTGREGDLLSRLPTISRDGSTIAFLSDATTLVDGSASANQVYVRDLLTNNTSRPLSGTAAVGWYQLSSDGRYLVARTSAVVVRDRFGTGTLTVANSTDALWPAISGDGRYIAMMNTASGGRLVVAPRPQ